MSSHAPLSRLDSVDQVRLAVVQNALVGVAREMGTIMERASYSSILNEGKDFSCAVFNRDGDLVAEGEFVLVHLAAMHEAVQVLVRHFGERWQPGDIAVHNDPYEGGSHLPDINVVRPVFEDGEVTAYVATRAHYPDVGGIVPGSFSGEAESLFHEGIVIPPLLIARGDVLDEQLIDFWARNVRVPRRLRADLMAQIASVRVGERSFHDVCERLTREAVIDVLGEIPAYGELLMRNRIEAYVSGENELYDFMDDAGADSLPVRIRLRVHTQGSSVTFDYRSSDPQVPCPVNAPLAVVKSATYGAIKCLLVPEFPLNSGMFRPINVLTDAGSVVDPVAPAPVAAGNTNTSQRIFDLCLACLDEMMKGGSGGMAGSYSANSDIGIGGTDTRTGDDFVLYMMPVGGIGARPQRDGESALINYMGNCSSQPVEVWESMYPLRVTQYRLRDDSAGPGRRRGGFGLCLSYEALESGLEVSIFTERQRFSPFGLKLGQPGAPGHYRLRRGDREFIIPTKTSGLWLRRGDVIDLETPGGGGYGNPFERELHLIAQDVHERLVSAESAASEYGAVVKQDGSIDHAATERLRASLHDQRQIIRASITKIDSDDGPWIAVDDQIASTEGLVSDAIVYCFSSLCAAYARVRVHAGAGVVVSATVARALHLEQGEEIRMRPLATRWIPYRTDDIRREFAVTEQI